MSEEQATSDTQWKVFEVFHQQARGEPHPHVVRCMRRMRGFWIAQ